MKAELVDFSTWTQEDRFRLLRFLCSFAWADLKVFDSELDFIAETVHQFELNEKERLKVIEWMKVPPKVESLDPTDIPLEQRDIYLKAIRKLIASDGNIDTNEAEYLALFEQLIASN